MNQVKPNGCGAANSKFNPPDLVFKSACDDHDEAYDLGGTNTDRKQADERFLSGMKASVRKRPWYYRPFYYTSAYTYYAAVRLFGAEHFNRETK